MDKKDFLAEGETEFYFSLEKVAGQSIKEVVGHVSYEFDEPVFALSRVIFEDGTGLFIEGEHDLPYISPGYGPYKNSTKFAVDLRVLRGSIDE